MRLFNKNCGSTNSSLAMQFDDSGSDLDCNKTTEQMVLPVDLLSVFNGQSPEGTWTLRVRDAVTGMFGTVNSASINICGQTYTLDTPNFENINNYALSVQATQKHAKANAMMMVEALPKNTAAAIAFAALAVNKDDILLVTPSDHIIENIKSYQNLLPLFFQ